MPGNYSHTTRADGTTLSAAIYNADHVNHITNATPAGLDDYQASLSEKQVQSNPTAGLSSALAGDLAQLRYVLAKGADTDFWYNVGSPPQMFQFINKAAATVGTKKEGGILAFGGTIVEARVYSDVAPTVQALIFDINKNGTSIWNTTPANRLQVAPTQNAGTQTAFDTTAVAAGDRLDLDIDQIGTVAGGNWSRVCLRVKPLSP